MISRALSVSLIYNDWRLQFYWPQAWTFPTPNSGGGGEGGGLQYFRCGKMKDLYNASIIIIINVHRYKTPNSPIKVRWSSHTPFLAD